MRKSVSCFPGAIKFTQIAQAYLRIKFTQIAQAYLRIKFTQIAQADLRYPAPVKVLLAGLFTMGIAGMTVLHVPSEGAPAGLQQASLASKLTA